MRVPDVRRRLSAVLGREVAGHERQADILLELLELLEDRIATEGADDDERRA